MQPQWTMRAPSLTKIVAGCETIRTFPGIHQRILVSMQVFVLMEGILNVAVFLLATMIPSWRSPGDMQSALLPTRALLCVLGVAPSKGFTLHACYNVLVTAGVVASGTVAITRCIQDGNSQVLVNVCFLTVVTLLHCTSLTFLLANLVRGGNVTSHIFTRISEVDGILLKRPVVSYRKLQVIQLLAILFLFVASGFLIYLDLFMRWDSPTPVFFISVVNFTGILSCSMNYYIALLITVVWHRYKLLNQTLCCAFENLETRVFCLTMKINTFFRHHARARQSQATNRSVEDTLQQKELIVLRRAYFSLAEVVNSIKFLYGLPVLVCTITYLISVVWLLYFGLKEEHVNDRSCRTVFRSAYILFVEATLTYACNLVETEAKETATYLRKILLWADLGENELHEVQLFLQDVSCSRVAFTACDYIRLDARFMTAFIGTVERERSLVQQSDDSPRLTHAVQGFYSRGVVGGRGSLPDCRKWEAWRTMPLAGGLLPNHCVPSHSTFTPSPIGAPACREHHGGVVEAGRQQRQLAPRSLRAGMNTGGCAGIKGRVERSLTHSLFRKHGPSAGEPIAVAVRYRDGVTKPAGEDEGVGRRRRSRPAAILLRHPAAIFYDINLDHWPVILTFTPLGSTKQSGRDDDPTTRFRRLHLTTNRIKLTYKRYILLFYTFFRSIAPSLHRPIAPSTHNSINP
ncbi:hypothetical protein PR048_032312 [Dryococelus australis]|uniref:Gustatory receptor n=1 Tax=Dryococelus australis TaxID=614101 RepID=A0ABQ9G1V2_9NEOP|nr:hypothetical protein PR048_032312 [Dryococelus australis]